MLVSLNKILPHARQKKYAVGAFNINNLEIAQGIVAGAAALKAPVVLQTSSGALEYAGLEYLAAIAHVAAETHKIPIVLHLDHGTDPALVERVIKSGWYTSVMIDASKLPFAKNIHVTRRIVELAHARGMSVEAELGPILGVEDHLRISGSEAAFTDPAQVKKFIKETRCDALAISVGTAHGLIKYPRGVTPKLDIARIETIAALTTVPLVLHGASSVPHTLLEQLHKNCERAGDCSRAHDAIGVPEKELRRAIAAGICKINVDTDVRLAFAAAVRDVMMTEKDVVDPRKILAPARAAITELVKYKIKLFGRP